MASSGHLPHLGPLERFALRSAAGLVVAVALGAGFGLLAFLVRVNSAPLQRVDQAVADTLNDLVAGNQVLQRVLVGVLLAVLFAYVLPYVVFRGGQTGQLQGLLPDRLTSTLLGGFPFFGGVFALILAVLVVGGEYGWDTLKTLLTQRPGRSAVFFAKLAALAVALLGFVLAVFVAGALASYVIAGTENARVSWPGAGEVFQAVGGAWLIMCVWAAFGVLLAVLSRGTALAIGLGIVYTLVLEGLLSALATQVSWLDPFAEFFIRANAYSLVSAIGVPAGSLSENGPGAFAGPFVSGLHALLVLVAYLAVFVAVSVVVFRRRDVSGK